MTAPGQAMEKEKMTIQAQSQGSLAVFTKSSITLRDIPRKTNDLSISGRDRLFKTFVCHSPIGPSAEMSMTAKGLTGMQPFGNIPRMRLIRKNIIRVWLVVAVCLVPMAWGAGVLFCADCIGDIGADVQRVVHCGKAAMVATSHGNSGGKPENCMDCRDLSTVVMRARHSNGSKSLTSQGIAAAPTQPSLYHGTSAAARHDNALDAGQMTSQALRSVVLLI
jgi:hypothetical protein